MKKHGGILNIRVNYLLIVVALTYMWIVLDAMSSITSIYNLSNNFWVIDTVTFVQSFNSAIFSHMPYFNNINGASFYAVHSSFIMYFLTPFYSILPGFPILFVMQDIIVYSSTVPLYLLARKKLGDDFTAFLMSISLLLFNAVETSNFESLTLFLGLFIFAFYFYEEKRYAAFLVFFLLSMITMEFAPVVGGMFGLYIIITRLFSNGIGKSLNFSNFRKMSNYISGISLIILSIILFIMELKLILIFSFQTHNPLDNLYGASVTSPGGQLSGLSYYTDSKISYIFQLNSPYFLLSFLDPVAILQIPWIYASSISTFGPYFTYWAYYNSYMIPFIVIGAVYGLARIGRLSVDRRKVMRIIAVLIVVGMAATWYTSPNFSAPSPVGASDLGAIQVASSIPRDASVFSDIYSFPVVSSQAWNTTYFGQPREYTVFGASDGPPYSLKNYSLYSASGSYMAYRENYSSGPVFNNFYDSIAPSGSSVPGIGFSYTSSIFVPSGNYTLSADITQFNAPGVEIFDRGITAYRFFPETEYAVQEFHLNSTVKADYIVVGAVANFGYYGFSIKLTRSPSPASPAIAINYFSNYANDVNSLTLNGPFTLYPGTYYLWVGTSGDPGGISLPLVSGSGLTLMNTTSYVTTELPYALQFALVGDIPGFVPQPTKVVFSLISGNLSESRSIVVNSRNNYLYSHFTSRGAFFSFSFLSSLTYGVFTVKNITVYATGAKPPSYFILQNPGGFEVLLLSPLILVVGIAFMDISISGNEIWRRVRKYSLISIGSLFALFFIIYYIGYYNIVPSLYSAKLFGCIGIIIAASMLAYAISNYLAGSRK